MGKRDLHLCRDQGRRQSAVDVPNHRDQVWRLPDQQFLKLNHHPSGLFGVGTRANPQVKIRLGEAEIREEHIAHVCVIVLTGVNQPLIQFPTVLNSPMDRSDLHEVGPRTHHVQHRLAHRARKLAINRGPGQPRQKPPYFGRLG